MDTETIIKLFLIKKAKENERKIIKNNSNIESLKEVTLTGEDIDGRFNEISREIQEKIKNLDNSFTKRIDIQINELKDTIENSIINTISEIPTPTNGKDYVLTSEDLEDIARLVDVEPIVIKEQTPIQIESALVEKLDVSYLEEEIDEINEKLDKIKDLYNRLDNNKVIYGGGRTLKISQLTDVDISNATIIDGKIVIPKSIVSGWGQYLDNQYTESSPFFVTNGSVVDLPNNSATIINRLPNGYNDLYDGSKIRPWESGDRISLSVRLKVKSSVNKGALNLKLDIGGSQGVILSDSRYLIRGAVIEQLINFEMTPYCLDTFIANGGQLKIESVYGDLEVYDINYVIGKIN